MKRWDGWYVDNLSSSTHVPILRRGWVGGWWGDPLIIMCMHAAHAEISIGCKIAAAAVGNN